MIPNSITSIEDGAFYGCGSLIDVVIPNSVTWIAPEASLWNTVVLSEW